MLALQGFIFTFCVYQFHCHVPWLEFSVEDAILYRLVALYFHQTWRNCGYHFFTFCQFSMLSFTKFRYRNSFLTSLFLIISYWEIIFVNPSFLNIAYITTECRFLSWQFQNLGSVVCCFCWYSEKVTQLLLSASSLFLFFVVDNIIDVPHFSPLSPIVPSPEPPQAFTHYHLCSWANMHICSLINVSFWLALLLCWYLLTLGSIPPKMTCYPTALLLPPEWHHCSTLPSVAAQKVPDSASLCVFPEFRIPIEVLLQESRMWVPSLAGCQTIRHSN